jgi:hypothetical protein
MVAYYVPVVWPENAMAIDEGIGGLMEDFVSSAERHFEDGEVLLELNRFDNAGHLFGVAGECAVKAVCIEESGTWPTKHFDNALTKDLRAFALPNLIGRKGQHIASLLPNLFSGWCIGQRYVTTGTTTDAQAQAWRADARLAIDALQGI